MRPIRILSLCSIILAMALPCLAASTMAKVTSVVNGNTLMVDIRGKTTQLRLAGVATPDPKDARPMLKKLGEEAAAYLEETVNSKWIMIEYPSGEAKPDTTGIVDGYVYVTNRVNTAFVNETMVSEGLAIVNRKVRGPMTTSFLTSETKAKELKKGIWGSFAYGGGKQAASGRQGTYLGQPGNQDGGRYGGGEVYLWIITFW